MFFKKYKKKITEQSEIIEKLNTRLSEDGINQLAQAKKQLLVENSTLESEIFSIKGSLHSEQEQVKKLTNDNESLKERLASSADELLDLKKEFRLISEKLENETMIIKPADTAFDAVEAKKILLKFFEVNGYENTKAKEMLTDPAFRSHPVLMEAISYLYQKDISLEIIATLCNTTVPSIRTKLIVLRVYVPPSRKQEIGNKNLKNKDDCVKKISSLLNITYLSSFIKIDKSVLRTFCEKLIKCPNISIQSDIDANNSLQKLLLDPLTRKQRLSETIVKILGMDEVSGIFTIERADKPDLLTFITATVELIKLRER